MNLSKGIEPIIAVVILIAVTLVIAIGVIGWIMGWWGTLGATESLQFYPDSEIKNSVLVLHVKNIGSAAAVIYKIEVVGLDTVTSLATYTSYSTTTGALNEVTIDPGKEVYIAGSVAGGNLIAGANYLVKIYTKAGNVYSVTVQAK